MKNQREWWEILDTCKEKGVLKTGEIHRAYLFGPPGTGKSSWPAVYMNAERVAITKGTTSDHLLGIFTLQEGRTVWVDGPVARAFRNGTPIVLDEINEYSEDVEALLHAVLDDASICQIQLTNGEILRPKEGFMVFGTTNGSPDELGEALRDRFELFLCCNKPHPKAIEKLPMEIRSTVVNQYSSIKSEPISVERFSVRKAMAFPKLAMALSDEDLAAWLLFGAQGKEFISVMASNRAATSDDRIAAELTALTILS